MGQFSTWIHTQIDQTNDAFSLHTLQTVPGITPASKTCKWQLYPAEEKYHYNAIKSYQNMVMISFIVCLPVTHA